jgi:phosphate transport system substrate-binding protein
MKKLLTTVNLFTILLGAIALIGLPSCTPTVKTPANSADSATNNTAQTPIKIGGSSSALSLLKTLASQYKKITPNAQITELEPGQSENVIAGIQQGFVDIGGISKTLTPKENNGSLESREIAKDALLVATHPSVTGVKNLSTENLKAIYSGTITNWQQLGGPDAKIVLLDRPEDESAKRLLRKHYLGANLPNSPAAIVLRKEGELIQSLESTPYSIGAFSLAHAISHNLPVNRLSLNGIAPNPEALKSGKYAMVRTIVIAWAKNAKEPTQALVDYLFSPQSAQTLEQAGFVTTFLRKQEATP